MFVECVLLESVGVTLLSVRYETVMRDGHPLHIETVRTLSSHSASTTLSDTPHCVIACIRLGSHSRLTSLCISGIATLAADHPDHPHSVRAVNRPFESGRGTLFLEVPNHGPCSSMCEQQCLFLSATGALAAKCARSLGHHGR